LTYARLSTKPNGYKGQTMIRHVVMLKFIPEVSQEQRLKLREISVAALGQIPGVKNVITGQALDIEGRPVCDAAVFIDFDDEAKLKAYLGHPVHKAAEAQLPAMCSDIKVLDCLY
jgi:hypothetical protein